MSEDLIQSYSTKDLSIATICSHTALQIFHGARQEGFKTIGICRPERKELYEAFPYGSPDEFLLVDDFSEILQSEIQDRLIDAGAIMVPHGSFVEYVGPSRILEDLRVPTFGNKMSLNWEGNRHQELKWLSDAKLRLPNKFEPHEIDRLCIVKFHGAKGGRGFLLVSSEEEYHQLLEKSLKEGKISRLDADTAVIQEYAIGVRCYVHYFYSSILNRLELLSMDQRLESNIDELHRMGSTRQELAKLGVDPSYVVMGNIPMVLRESLLPEVLALGERTIESSQKLFSPGLTGPFCLEMICTPELEFIVFEISARIVAGTNLFPLGSPYSCYLWGEAMSTGRRIAWEMKEAQRTERLGEIIS